jgi:hypothetical protein
MDELKISEPALPEGIDPVWLEELRARGAERRKVEAMVREQLGLNEQPTKSFVAHILDFPKIDCDDAIFDRYANQEDWDVPR